MNIFSGYFRFWFLFAFVHISGYVESVKKTEIRKRKKRKNKQIRVLEDLGIEFESGEDEFTHSREGL